MGTTRTLADGEAFVQGRSKDNAAALVTAAAELGLKGSVKTTYDGYLAPVEVVEAAGLGSSTESSTPENPADHSDAPPVKPESSDDQDVDPEVLAQLEAEKAAAAAAESGTSEEESDQTDHGDEVDPFDPTASTVAEVKAYLDGADDVERARVIDAEKASAKPRTGVLELAAIPEGAK